MLKKAFNRKILKFHLGFAIAIASAISVTTLAAGCTSEAQVAAVEKEAEEVKEVLEEKVTSIAQLKSVADNAFSDEALTDASWTSTTSSVRKAGITRNNMLSVGKKAFLNAQFTKLDLPNLVYVGIDAFSNNTKLTSIRLPNAREVYYGSFADCPLTEVYLPRVMMTPNLRKVVNEKSTVITLPSIWNKPEEISRLFTSADDPKVVAPHDKITFVWVDETKEPLGDIEGGLNFTSVAEEDFKGQPLTDSDWDAPNGVIAKANYSRDSVAIIWYGAFIGAKFTKLSLPVVTSIDSSAFGGNTELSSVILPHVNKLGSYAFSGCPLTEFFAPKLFDIYNENFRSTVNASTTRITLPVVHNSPVKLDDMFFRKQNSSGVSFYDKITFVWVDDNGNELPDVKTNLTPLPDTP